MQTLQPVLLLVAAAKTSAWVVLQTAGGDQATQVQKLLLRLDSYGKKAPEGGQPVQPAFLEVKVHEDCYRVVRFVSATRAPRA